MMTEELKACPFCGEPGVWRDDGHADCDNQDCGPYQESDQQSILWWNTRPLEDALRAELEQARDRIVELESRLDIGTGNLGDITPFPLIAENARLREALKFYADVTNYGALMPASVERGTKARAALAGKDRKK